MSASAAQLGEDDVAHLDSVASGAAEDAVHGAQRGIVSEQGADAVREPSSTSAPRSAAKKPSLLSDLLMLGKPGIVRMCVITTIGGLWLAPMPVSLTVALSAVVGSSLAVICANALNMIWERNADRLMARTRGRPLAAGRMETQTAAVFAAVTGILGLLVLALGTNLLTAGLALFAILSYVLVYTPMKYRSPAALVIGAFPGAIPPLLGWTAATNDLSTPGLILFGILLIWQVPHFLAISLYRMKEYEAAGIRCAPLVRGVMATKLQAIAWSLALVPVSLALTPLGVTGPLYFAVALIAGLVYFAWGLTGLREGADGAWARGYFFASLVYLPVITAALILDALLF